MRHPFHGLIAAPYSPFHQDLSINPGVIPAYARHLRESGVRGIFICGTTGEGASLTSTERVLLAEHWMREAGPELDVIIHVGHTAIAESRALAAHAQKIGAAAIGAMAPYFYKPRNTEELVAWCAAIADAAPELPFYYYHIPSMNGYDLPVVDFLRLAEKRIPSLCGVKFTHNNLADYAECQRQWGDRYNILFGRDELLLEGLQAGSHGAVGSTYNYAAPLYLRITSAYKSGDMTTARELQNHAAEMVRVCCEFGVTHLAATKAIMPMLGVDCGPVRLPLIQPDSTQLSALRNTLEAAPCFPFFHGVSSAKAGTH